ncbi:MAG TPA: tripartite tricarboxylate transporter substrate binding protein [Burkholderiales bacterium]|nr:tripartite tricarboxylate transporter substrate binding protein [Burkholderiales bacterium]
MRRTSRKSVLTCIFLILAGLLPHNAAAEYPDKPVRLIAPFPPGGGVDIVARVIAQAMGENMRQQVIVDNRPGATGRIGTELVARAAPDGYTVLLGSVGANAIIPAAYSKLSYDAVNDFTPVSLIASAPYALVVHPSLRATSVRDLIALARERPGHVTYASSGNLSGAHLAGALMAHLAKVQMLHVPYKGAALAMNDLLGGQVAMTFAAISGAVPHVKAQRLRAVGVTGARRSASLPEVPAIGETLNGFNVTQWYGLFVPAATPAPVVKRLHSEAVKAIAQPAVNKRLVEIGTEPVGSSPDQLADQVKSEMARWGSLFKSGVIKIE